MLVVFFLVETGHDTSLSLLDADSIIREEALCRRKKWGEVSFVQSLVSEKIEMRGTEVSPAAVPRHHVLHPN